MTKTTDKDENAEEDNDGGLGSMTVPASHPHQGTCMLLPCVGLASSLSKRVGGCQQVMAEKDGGMGQLKSTSYTRAATKAKATKRLAKATRQTTAEWGKP